MWKPSEILRVSGRDRGLEKRRRPKRERKRISSPILIMQTTNSVKLARKRISTEKTAFR
jgi:hypothetical protein